MKNIGVKDAKNKLSEVLAASQDSPVTITHHGKPYSVVLSYEHYLHLQQEKLTGLDAFRDMDWSDSVLEPHPVVKARDIDIS